MPTSAELTQLQFEISMSIGNSLDLQQMLKVALGTILRKLNCISATVYQIKWEPNGRVALTPVFAVPRTAPHGPIHCKPLAYLPALDDLIAWRSISQRLPLVGESDGSHYHLCALSDWGILILIRREEALDSVVLKAIQPLLLKLADACRACQQNDELKQTNQQLVEKSQQLEASQQSLLALMQEMNETDTILQTTMLRLKRLISNIHAGLLVEDEHRHIVLANEQFCQIFGIPLDPAQMIGADCSESAREVAPLFVDPAGFIVRVDEILHQRRIVTGEEVTMVNGAVYERDYIPIHGEDNYLGHMWLYRDISERKRMEETLTAVLNTVGEGIITADISNQIVMINREIERIFGYRSQELLGHSLQVLMPEKYRTQHLAGMQRYHDQGVGNVLGKRIELEGVRKNGEIFPLEIFINETEIGERRLFTASVRDITRRREYDRMRDDFVSTVSHELRTPLTSIMGWTETLLTEDPGPLTELQRRFLTISYESSLRLNKLIEEILTVSRIQQGSLRLVQERFHPTAVLAATRKMMEGMAKRKEMTLIFEESLPEQVTTMGDPRRCEQVLENLISNALKFSPARSTVTVRSSQEDNQWRVEVTDQGIGIPAADIPQLFERFYRASNANSAQIQGTGLGLYICKAIVEGHGGQIHITSQEGYGTTVWFTIPLETSKSALLYNNLHRR